MAKILIADDVQEMRLLLRGILESAGHEVTEVPNGAFVLDTLRSGQVFDLLLLDIKMPMMDGLAVMKKMRSEIPESVRPAVCFISGQTDRALVVKAVALGADGYIVKPIDKDALLERVTKILSGTPTAQSTSEVSHRKVSAPAAIPGVPLVDTPVILEVSAKGCVVRFPCELKSGGTIELESPLLGEVLGSGHTRATFTIASNAHGDRHYTATLKFVKLSDSEVKSLDLFLSAPNP